VSEAYAQRSTKVMRARKASDGKCILVDWIMMGEVLGRGRRSALYTAGHLRAHQITWLIKLAAQVCQLQVESAQLAMSLIEATLSRIRCVDSAHGLMADLGYCSAQPYRWPWRAHRDGLGSIFVRFWRKIIDLLGAALAAGCGWGVATGSGRHCKGCGGAAPSRFGRRPR